MREARQPDGFLAAAVGMQVSRCMWVAGNVLLSLIDLCAWIEKQVSGFVMYVRGCLTDSSTGKLDDASALRKKRRALGAFIRDCGGSLRSMSSFPLYLLTFA